MDLEHSSKSGRMKRVQRGQEIIDECVMIDVRYGLDSLDDEYPPMMAQFGAKIAHKAAYANCGWM